MSTLQELILLSAEIESKLVANEGEVDEALAELMVEADKLPSKIDSITFVMDSLEKRAESLKSKEQEFYKARLSAEKGLLRLKSYIKEVMWQADIKKLNGGDSSFTLSKTTPRLVIEDEQLLLTNDEYVITTIDKKLDNAKIKQKLINGESVAGAKLEDSYALRKGVK